MPPLAPESCPLPRSGTVNDLGEDGGDGMLIMCLEEGSNNLTSGLVINPNTCTYQKLKRIIGGFFTVQEMMGVNTYKTLFPLQNEKMRLFQNHPFFMFN